MLANVKIEQDKENTNIHKVFVDGKQIEKITHLDFQVNPLEFPLVTLNLETMSGIDFEGQAEVNFLEIPFSVENACKILREELLKQGDLYRGFLASIQSAVKEKSVEIKEYVDIDCYKWSEYILRRIMGED